MINLKKESLTVLCGNQPIMGFVLLFCVGLAGETIFSDLFSVPFSAGLKYGMAIIMGFSALWGVNTRFKVLSKKNEPFQPQTNE